MSALRVDDHIRAALRVLGVKSRFEAAQRLRAWEMAQTVPSSAEPVGAQSVGLPRNQPPASDGDADVPRSEGSPADDTDPEATTHLSNGTPLQEPVKPMRSETDGRNRPPYILLAISLVAILAAIGAIATLLFAFDWVSRP